MMRQNPRLFRLSASVAISALLCNAILPVAAQAQPAPPPPAASPAQPGQAQGDPPARVGRIASETGAVSFRTTADTQWSAATLNYPVSTGNAFWTEPTAQAELEISASRVALAGQTEFDVTTLDDSGLQGVARQGEAWFHLVDLAPNEVWSVQTPRGMVRLTQAGRYDIAAGTTEQPTLITVLEGAAELDGPGLSLKIAANQTATVTGSDPFQGSVGPAVRDAFVEAKLKAEHPPSHPGASIPAQYSFITGVEDLSDYGEWSQASDYGEVWYPPVPASWVPYRDGEWAYVAPWGWTWVDSAPWGYAPFHYGRWAHIDDRWGWVPGDPSAASRPVYAPALVSFIGLSAGVAVGAAVAGSMGWVPLGPNEPYHPWYHASPNYLRQINTGHVRDPAAIDSPVSINGFVNRAAATSVPASVMTESRPIRTAARPVPARAFAAMHPLIGDPPLRPTVATFGVTPAVARQLSLVPTGRGIMPRRAAPGPVVEVPEPGGGAPARPALIGPRAEQPGPGRPVSLPVPGARPEGIPEPREIGRPGEPPVSSPPPVVHPEGMFRPPVSEEEHRPPVINRPIEEPPAPPRAPEFRLEPPRPAAPEPPREAPRVEPVRPPTPHVETSRPAPPRGGPEQKRPGER
jgi:hypothetical protein